MAGVRVYLQYSTAAVLGNDGEDDAVSSSERDRHLAAGAEYRGKDLRLALVVDNYFYNDVDDAGKDDPRSISLAANYRFWAFKAFGGYKHPFSKRTMIYGAASCRYADLTNYRTTIKSWKLTNQFQKEKSFGLMAGLQHRF